ncbi:MAG TPA: hypothetical protein VJQ84_08140 [Solirubrobacterales bacterium]|nr:hypothetical protein [Solirubrobacterales bacterium]
MIFDDVARETRYDLWVGDEAWNLDYHLHENPKRKRAPFAWLTDFVGWLPMPVGGEREAMLTADYNAEMVEHVRDHLELRDRAIFVGNPRTSSATASARICPGFANGPSAISPSPATSPNSTRPSWGIASACARSSAIDRTSVSASSPSAARA